MKRLHIILLNALIFFSLSTIYAQKLELSVQSGHLETVNKIGFSSDGKLLASGDDNGVVKIWDLRTRKEVRTLQTGISINALSFSANDKWLLALGNDRSSRVFEVLTGNKIAEIEKSGRAPNNTAAANGAKMFAAQIAEDGKLRVFNSLTAKEVLSYELSGVAFETSEIHSVAFNPDGNRIAVGALGKTVIVSVPQEKEVKMWKSGKVLCAAFAPDGQTLAVYEREITGGLTGKERVSIKMRSAISGALIRTISLPMGEIKSLEFNADSSILAAIIKTVNEKNSQDEYKVKLWNVQTGEKINEINFQDNESNFSDFTEVKFSPDGKTLAIAGGMTNDGRITLYNTADVKEIAQLKRQSETVNSIKISNNGLLISDSRVWDLKTLKQLHSGLIGNYAISSDAKRLATYNMLLGTYEIINLETGNHIARLNGKKFDITSNDIFFSPKDKYLLAICNSIFPCSNENKISLFNSETGNLLFTFPDKSKIIAFSDDEKLLTYAVEDEKNKKYAVWVWDVEAERARFSIDVPQQVTALSFNPKGNLLAVAGVSHYTQPNNDFLNLYDSTSGQILRLFGSQGRIEALAFSPDSKVLTTSAFEKIKLWNIEEAKEIKTLLGHDAWVQALTFTADQRFLVSAGSDGQIIFWNYQNKEIVSRLIVVNENDYLFISPENYYLASRRAAAAAVAFRKNTRAFPFEQFDIRYNRPDVVLSTFENGDPELIEFYAKAYKRRLRQFNLTEAGIATDLELPEVTVDLRPVPTISKRKVLSFQIHAFDKTNLLTRLNVYINDIPIYGAKGFSLIEQKKKAVTQRVELELTSGNNRIQVSVINGNGIESIRETFNVRYEGKARKPELYVVAIGVSSYKQKKYSLKYPDQDAANIVKLFENRARQKERVTMSLPDDYRNQELLKSFYRVHKLELINENATLEKINTTVDFLKSAKPEDEVIVFFSGHGLLDREKNYYFATYDVDFKNPSQRGLPFEELEKLLDTTKARRKVLLIDSCHAGEIDKTELEDLKINNRVDEGTIKSFDFTARTDLFILDGSDSIASKAADEIFTDLRLGSGAVIISASGGLEYAYESPRWSGGVFTYAVRLGLEEFNANKNDDSIITISELRDFVSKKVLDLTEGRQKPTGRHESIEYDFRIY